MEIRQITEDKENYLDMLLIADPQKALIKVTCLYWKMLVM